jgi:hypothetical protein
MHLGDEAQTWYDRYETVHEEVEVSTNNPMPMMRACGRNDEARQKM